MSKIVAQMLETCLLEVVMPWSCRFGFLLSFPLLPWAVQILLQPSSRCKVAILHRRQWEGSEQALRRLQGLPQLCIGLCIFWSTITFSCPCRNDLGACQTCFQDAADKRRLLFYTHKYHTSVRMASEFQSTEHTAPQSSLMWAKVHQWMSTSLPLSSERV